jgi:hypothetical protein
MPYKEKKLSQSPRENSLKLNEHQLKSHIKKIIKKLLKEEESSIMSTKEVSDTLENVLNSNVGIPFDGKEKETVILKQSSFPAKAIITKNNTEIKFSTTDEFGNNNVNVIKKLKNMSDPNTMVYASFFSNVPQKKAEPTSPEKPSATDTVLEKTVFIKMSQPFEDKNLNKLDIFGKFINDLDI